MTDQTEAQDQEQEQEQEQEPEQQVSAEQQEAEQQARKLGWRPEDEWDDSGTGTWLPADKFLERNERLKDRGDRILKAQVDRLERQNARLQQTIKDLGDHMSKADKRALEKARKEVRAKAEKAVEEGDTETYRQAQSELDDLEKEAKSETKTAPPSPDDDPDFQAWLPDNAWYDPREESFDPELAGFADFIAPQVGRTGLTGKALYDRIASEVKKKFPDRFGNQRRKQPPAVEAGGTRGGNGKTLWDDVPKDARETFKRFVEQGLFEDTKAGREKYADEYLNG